VDAFITEWRKEADAEISKANKTYEDGLRKKYDFAEKKTEQSISTMIYLTFIILMFKRVGEMQVFNN
ncbi:MAG: hypothetical protein LBF04_02680, partial [Prevotellaceae bacterium]|nr:hypothetical protein [Prevotellaceae bacterium]